MESGLLVTCCANTWDEFHVERTTQTGVSRDFVGNLPPMGGITRNSTDGGEQKVAVIAVSEKSQRDRVIRKYRKQGYDCYECELSEDWAIQSNLFVGSRNVTLVTDDLDLAWKVRLNELTEGQSVPIHAVVDMNEVLSEAQAITLGAAEILEQPEESIETFIEDLFCID